MKRVIYIRSSSIYSDSRATKEIKALAEFGYEVIVLGWDRTGDSEEKCKKLFSNIVKVENMYFFDLQIEHSGLKKVVSLLKWIYWIFCVLSKVNSKQFVDIIHACDFDTGISAHCFARKHNIKFVYDIYDYYSDAHTMSVFAKKIVSFLENRIVNGADLVIICTEERYEQIENCHPSKVIVIHNTPEIECVVESQKEYDYVYFGTLANGRLLEKVLDVYPKHKEVKMAFGGPGEYRNKCIELNEKYKSFNYVGIISYDEVLEIEKKSKCISAIYDPSIRNHRLCAPNKFYEAMAVGVPVIVCRGTGIDKIVEKNGIGIVIDFNEEDFYRAINYIISNPDESKEMGIKARNLYEREYNWKYMKKKLVEAYESLND